jgi:hypothetical protein
VETYLVRRVFELGQSPKLLSGNKSPGKILGKLSLADFRKIHNLFTGMVDKHGINIISSK